MTDCCTSQCQDKSKTSRPDCPVCGQKCLTVSVKTIWHHLRQPWLHKLTGQQYYFCKTPSCHVVYFSEGSTIINQSDIRTAIGIKQQSDDALICFCFGVSRAEAVTNRHAKEFVRQQTKASMCSCDTANPSGRCCLKDFPKFD